MTTTNASKQHILASLTESLTEGALIAVQYPRGDFPPSKGKKIIAVVVVLIPWSSQGVSPIYPFISWIVITKDCLSLIKDYDRCPLYGKDSLLWGRALQHDHCESTHPPLHVHVMHM